MKTLLTTTAALLALSGTAFAEVDLAKGEKDFKKCKACHAIVDDAGEVIVKGGKTGPNLYGIVGRTAGSYEGFKFGASIIAAGEAGLVWDEEQLIAYAMDPKAYLKDVLDDGAAKSKMTFKLKTPENVVAYLASLAPAPMAEEGEAEEAAADDAAAADGDTAASE
ncbi:c-type cytochrome [Aliiroseovarius subalbicans]|uniref:c-type cytochrome n=1 Tax=Aliiroseovarius subalbicans TaxID=2925840 RepID=UPI001F56D3F8|nr:c-type cytochrome [Aliiroseovarius subalbicans]MCI2399297.1 cytochrome C [Aliiroseovarius subalbicans]